MLSIHPMSIGSEEYYLDLAVTDYFFRPGCEPPGHWGCGGTKPLGLDGVVDKEAFRKLFRGYCPTTDRPLVQNAGHLQRQPGIDCTFSASKDVSVIWSQFPSIRQSIQEIQQLAVGSSLGIAESTIAFCRAGKQGSELVRARLVAAIFEHGTSRDLCPQLHSHALILNIGIGPDGQTRSILSKPFFLNKKFLGAYYRAEMARLLHEKHGFACQRKGESFTVEGVPEALSEAHSKGSQKIRARMEQTGKHGASEAAKAALATRQRKQEIPARSELFKRWQKVNESYGFTHKSLKKLKKAMSGTACFFFALAFCALMLQGNMLGLVSALMLVISGIMIFVAPAEQFHNVTKVKVTE